jgi:hypothetical protein
MLVPRLMEDGPAGKNSGAQFVRAEARNLSRAADISSAASSLVRIIEQGCGEVGPDICRRFDRAKLFRVRSAWPFAAIARLVASAPAAAAFSTSAAPSARVLFGCAFSGNLPGSARRFSNSARAAALAGSPGSL